MSADVFISHSRKDSAVAESACEALEAAGITCWLDTRSIRVGEDWPAAIVRGIRSCRIFLLVFSGHSNASDQIKRELHCAESSRLTIIPFIIEQVSYAPNLEYYLSPAHYLDATTPPLEPHLQRLVIAIRQTLDDLDNRPTESAAPASPPQPNRPKPALSAANPQHRNTPLPAPRPAANPIPGRSSRYSIAFALAMIALIAFEYFHRNSQIQNDTVRGAAPLAPSPPSLATQSPPPAPSIAMPVKTFTLNTTPQPSVPPPLIADTASHPAASQPPIQLRQPAATPGPALTPIAFISGSFQPGEYIGISGREGSFSVSGPIPVEDHRTRWLGTSREFSAMWVTGAAKGNPDLPNIPIDAVFPPGWSFGTDSSGGQIIAAQQLGDELIIAILRQSKDRWDTPVYTLDGAQQWVFRKKPADP